MIMASAVTIILQLISAAPSGAQPSGDDRNLPMVPVYCRESSNVIVSTTGLLVFYNKIINFSLEGTRIRSEIRGRMLYATRTDAPGTYFYDIPMLLPFAVRDVQVYHAFLNGRPVVIWKETVANMPARAGILEYRGHGLYPLCDGLTARSLVPPA
jgi:hypothetical protein